MTEKNSELARTFYALGMWPKKTVDYSPEVMAAKGTPDYTVHYHPGRYFLVERKWAPRNFSFSQITPEQRAYLSHGPAKEPNVLSAVWESLSFLWLCIGERVNAKTHRRRTWLIPWNDYLEVEQRFICAGLDGMALETPHRLEHRRAGLSAVEQLSPWELEWSGGWKIPRTHSFWRRIECLNTTIPFPFSPIFQKSPGEESSALCLAES